MSSERYFPIVSKTSCRNKWAWSTIYLNNGDTGSCHRASISAIGTDFENFHNTDKKIAARKAMLRGDWPGDGCEHCSKIEAAGGQSDRQFQNQIPYVYPSELDTDPTQVVVNPVILEVFFANTCNLKCVYCSARFSSSIQQEDSRFGGAVLELNDFTYSDNRYQELVPKFWNWFENNGSKLHRLQVLGGEPFLQKDLAKLIDYLELNPMPKLEFNIVTNLSLPPAVIRPQIQKLAALVEGNKVGRVDILASVECWGPSQEYIRKGFDCRIFEQNLQDLIETKLFRIGLLSTITSMSIPTMPGLVQKYYQWNAKQTVHWYMHHVLPHNDSIFSPSIFDFSVFESSLEQVANQLPTDSWDHKTTKDIYMGIVSDLKNRCQPHKQKQVELYNYLDQMDHRRNTNWQDTFPWLAKELQHVV